MQRQRHREIAGVEILDGFNSHHIDFVLRPIGKFGGHNQHPMPTFAVFRGEGFH
jgi:hypothetical protein